MSQICELVPFRMVHLDLMEPDIELTHKMLVAMMDARMKGPAFTLYVDGEIGAVAGVAVVWEGVGEAWGILDPKAPILYATRLAKSMLKEVKVNLNLRRIQTFTLTQRCYDWVKLLGFEHEGIVKKYGPNGEDLNVWSIT